MSTFKEANKLFKNGRLNEAVEKYKASIEKGGELPVYFSNLGWAYELLGMNEKASVYYEKARSLGYPCPRAEKFLGDAGLESHTDSVIDGLLPELPCQVRRSYRKGDLQRAEKNTVDLRKKMLSLGFYETALAELEEQAEARNPARRLLASRELALYYSNQETPEGAEKANRYIDYCLKNELNDTLYRKAVIMKAEGLRLRGKRQLEAAFFREVKKEIGEYPDLILAHANTIDSADSRIIEVNKLYQEAGLVPISLAPARAAEEEDYNRLIPKEPVAACPESKGRSAPLVTVIVPTYNAEDTLPVALNSLLAQTWSKVEILVVDDCSTDGTVDVVRSFINKDSRIRLIQAEQNGGPYVARNLALLEAKGDYITTNDADDWSHPQKLEIQVRHLMSNPEILGNTSQQARATPDLTFHRRGNYGYYIFMNMSSFMFRREVLKDVGFWDCVRFGADSEFIRRIKKARGGDCLADLPTVPLSFQRQSAGSLTGNSAFGYHGFFMGARREHFESYLQFHKDNDTTYYPFPQTKRPFSVPEPMRPVRAPKNSEGQREFDVAIVSDFRLDGGSTLSSIEEIKAHKAAGLSTALVQMCRYDYPANKKVNPLVRELLEDGVVEFVVYGERLKCRHALFRYPPILQHRQAYVPEIEAEKVSVIVNQPPMSDYGPKAELRYELPKANDYVKALLGKDPVWRPIGPAVREALTVHHADDLRAIQLAEDDWCNIIDVDHWFRGDYTPRTNLPILARHSRDNRHKWPGTKQELLKAYPDSDEYKVKVLGGANTPAKILGRVPGNWEVHEFGALHPRDFLQDVDIYVYYTHPDWVESFGRVVLEAMAVGVPVVLPKAYKPLFGNAASYANLDEVKTVIKKLLENPLHYREVSQRSCQLVRQNFSYEAHIRRVGF